MTKTWIMTLGAAGAFALAAVQAQTPAAQTGARTSTLPPRSEEHTSELQSH